MVLLGLLLVALICLVLGLVLASGAWLAGSLAASVVAAIALWRSRDQLNAGSRHADSAPPARGSRPLVTGSAFAGRTGSAAQPDAATAAAASEPDVWVVDGHPRYHRKACLIIEGEDAEQIPLAQATGDGFIPCSMCTPDEPGGADR